MSTYVYSSNVIYFFTNFFILIIELLITDKCNSLTLKRDVEYQIYLTTTDVYFEEDLPESITPSPEKYLHLHPEKIYITILIKCDL